MSGKIPKETDYCPTNCPLRNCNYSENLLREIRIEIDYKWVDVGKTEFKRLL